jgi:hypothetical protein
MKDLVLVSVNISGFVSAELIFGGTTPRPTKSVSTAVVIGHFGHQWNMNKRK